MKKTVFAACLLLCAFAYSQNVLSGKEVYRISCKAVVQIKADDEIGVGFIVSSDGRIVTANHVVTSRSSKFRSYASHIQVFVAETGKIYDAKPIADSPSPDDANFDFAVIKITASGLPYLTLGSWDEVTTGDSVTVIPTFPGVGCLLLEGIVSGKAAAQTDFGPKPVDMLIFQIPIRNGFSGSRYSVLPGTLLASKILRSLASVRPSIRSGLNGRTLSPVEA